MASNNISNFNFLFGDYFIELSRFFATFSASVISYEGTNEYKYITYPMIVMLGSPTAAYRRLQNITNNTQEGKEENKSQKYPLINFVPTNFDRVVGMEVPYARRLTRMSNNYTRIDRDIQRWNITYQMSLWTSSYRMRDDILSKIFRSFPAGEMALQHYPNPDNPGYYYNMEFKLEGGFNDSTDLESLDQKQTRDTIRTDFTISGPAVLPYENNTVGNIKYVDFSFNRVETIDKFQYKFEFDENGDMIYKPLYTP
jgi:hypothetical protein